MNYISSAQAAQRWKISERSVRNYCALGKIHGAFLTGKTWSIPENTEKPDRINRRKDISRSLLTVLKAEKKGGMSGGIYHKVQIELTYNSNRIEGSRLTHDQTRYIFETNTIDAEGQALSVDDIVETANHFRCIDMVIDSAGQSLSERWIKGMHAALKGGTSLSRESWFAVGEYKKLPNEVGGKETTAPNDVPEEMRALLSAYNGRKEKTLEEILEYHCRFEAIHPFQDGNGRVGRLIMFKECLRNNIVPFVIDDEVKLYYYRGLSEWKSEKGYLMDTCLNAQDRFKTYLDYFRIEFE